jgi:hypothetical protein
MIAENRHYHRVWKKKRKHKPGHLCGNAKCFICHPHKVFGFPNRQMLRQISKECNDKKNFSN